MEMGPESIAVVTGGASGLGAATCKLLGQKGVQVIIIDANGKQAEELAAEINGQAFVCDVSSAGQSEEVFREIVEKIGIPRVLINCAGIVSPSKILGKKGLMPLEFFQRTIDVNLVGTFNLLRLASAGMMKRDADHNGQRGVIISTASIAAYEGQIGQTAYAASKAGIIGMTLPAARELAPFGIRVNAIAPGVFKTPLVEGLPVDAQQSLAANIPNPARLGQPEEFAKLVWHLIENDYINGEVIRIDGALRMQPK